MSITYFGSITLVVVMKSDDEDLLGEMEEFNFLASLGTLTDLPAKELVCTFGGSGFITDSVVLFSW
jgi:hypothetical protein